MITAAMMAKLRAAQTLIDTQQSLMRLKNEGKLALDDGDTNQLVLIIDKLQDMFHKVQGNNVEPTTELRNCIERP